MRRLREIKSHYMPTPDGEELSPAGRFEGVINMNAMTDKQFQFIAWLITTATDKCKDMDEVRKMNEEIRKHAAGL